MNFLLHAGVPNRGELPDVQPPLRSLGLKGRSDMNTDYLFSVHASSSYQCLFLRDPKACPGLFETFHRATLLPTWKPQEFAFRVAGRKGVAFPDICTVYARGVLAMRSDVKDALFPWIALDAHWEFLPVVVEQERWWLLNCPGSETAIDSEVERQQELFAVARPSSAQQLFARALFKSRVERLRLKGLEFQRVGRLMAQEP